MNFHAARAANPGPTFPFESVNGRWMYACDVCRSAHYPSEDNAPAATAAAHDHVHYIDACRNKQWDGTLCGRKIENPSNARCNQCL